MGYSITDEDGEDLGGRGFAFFDDACEMAQTHADELGHMVIVRDDETALEIYPQAAVTEAETVALACTAWTAAKLRAIETRMFSRMLSDAEAAVAKLVRHGECRLMAELAAMVTEHS